jgi:flagellar basal-body rod modification protein FlgD
MSGTVSSTLSNLTNTAASTTVGSSTSGTAAISFDSNEWLTLLTTELQYQDPTSPSDPTQFVAQLAQFSAVSQQVATNTTLNTISSQLSASALGQSASMIGKTVQGAASSYVVPSSGTAPSVSYDFNITDSTLKNPQLQITNASGNIVGVASVSGSSGTVSFDGTGTNGSSLPAGTYSVALVGTSSTSTTETAGTLSTSGTVTSILQNNGTTELQLDNGSAVAASSIQNLSD